MSTSSPFTASAHDLEQLRTALLSTDKQTQAFVGPLLPLRAVQQVLLSFLRDRTRSFEDWVWDPSVRQLLNQLREQNPQAHHHAQDVDRWFEQAAQDQWTYQQTQHAPTASEQLLHAADDAQDDGKRKFKQRDFYAAKNAFEKSLASLTAYIESESYDSDASNWDPPMQARYVTLCNNIAICGIKMKALSVIREYSRKALAVDATSSKALYATAKLHLMEHLYEDAYAAVNRALQTDPNNQLLVKFRAEIDNAQAQEALEHADLARVAEQKLAADRCKQQEHAERQQARDAARVTASDFVPLPVFDDDRHATAHLNTYFQRIKHEVRRHVECVLARSVWYNSHDVVCVEQLRTEIKQLHDPDNSEPPLFACTMTDATTGAVLAADVQAPSKKGAKNDASKRAIQALWAMKTDAGTLLEEDVAYMAKAQATLAPPAERATDSEHESTNALTKDAATEPEQEDDAASASRAQLPVRLFSNERCLDTVMLLNQLHQQKRLHVDFAVEDLLPDAKDRNEFRCTVRINGAPLGVATAPAKKKARVEAARLAFAAALEQDIVCYWDPDASDDSSSSDSPSK